HLLRWIHSGAVRAVPGELHARSRNTGGRWGRKLLMAHGRRGGERRRAHCARALERAAQNALLPVRAQESITITGAGQHTDLAQQTELIIAVPAFRDPTLNQSDNNYP